MKDHITQYAEALRNLESALEASGFQKSARSAGETAQRLENYKSSVRAYQYKEPPHVSAKTGNIV